MSFLGQFAGNTAKNTDDSLREWRRLMLQEEEYQTRKKQAEDQLTIQRDQLKETRRQFDWNKELDQMRLDLQNQQLTDQRVSTWYSNVSQGWDEMTPAQRLQVVNTFESSEIATQGIGSDYQTLLRARVRDDMSPRNARQYLAGVLNTPWGQRVPQWAVDDALSALEGQEDYDSIRADIENFTGAENEAEAEEARKLAREGAFAAVEQQQAAAAVDRAQVGYIGAQTQLAVQQHGITEEMQPLLMEHQALINEGLSISNIAETIRTGALPEQLRLGLRSMANEVEKGDLDNQILSATVQDVIAQIQAEADISIEQARHLVVTGGIRDALVNQEFMTGQENLELIRANINALNAQTEATDLGNIQTRTEIVDTLISNGRADLLSEVGMELLEPLFGEEIAGELVESMTADAFRQKDILQRRETAGLLMAEAEASFMLQTLPDRVITERSTRIQEQWKADNMDRVYEDEQALRNWELGIRQQGVELEGERVDIARFAANTDRMLATSQMAVNAARAADLRAGPTPASNTPIDIFNAIDDAGLGSRNRVGDRLADYGEVQSEIDRLDQYIEAAEVASENGQSVNIPADLQEQYGMNPADLEVARNALRVRADAMYNSAVREARAVYNAAIGQGLIAKPEDFGLNPQEVSDQEFWDDVQSGTHGRANIPSLIGAGEDGTVNFADPEQAREAGRAQVVADLASRIDMYAPELSTGWTPLTADSMWDVLIESGDYTEESLAAVGFRGPESLAPAIGEAVNAYNEAARGANTALQLASQFTGQEYDLHDINDLNDVSTRLGGRVQALSNVMEEVTTADSLSSERLITYVATTLGMTQEELVDNGFADVGFRMLPTNAGVLPAGQSNLRLDFNAIMNYAQRELGQLDEALNGLSIYQSRF